MCVIDVGGPADPIAPSIIVPPKNTSVTMGRNEAVIECVANARYAFFFFSRAGRHAGGLYANTLAHLHIRYFMT